MSNVLRRLPRRARRHLRPPNETVAPKNHTVNPLSGLASDDALTRLIDIEFLDITPGGPIHTSPVFPLPSTPGRPRISEFTSEFLRPMPPHTPSAEFAKFTRAIQQCTSSTFDLSPTLTANSSQEKSLSQENTTKSQCACVRRGQRSDRPSDVVKTKSARRVGASDSPTCSSCPNGFEGAQRPRRV